MAVRQRGTLSARLQRSPLPTLALCRSAGPSVVAAHSRREPGGRGNSKDRPRWVRGTVVGAQVRNEWKALRSHILLPNPGLRFGSCRGLGMICTENGGFGAREGEELGLKDP